VKASVNNALLGATLPAKKPILLPSGKLLLETWHLRFTKNANYERFAAFLCVYVSVSSQTGNHSGNSVIRQMFCKLDAYRVFRHLVRA